MPTTISSDEENLRRNSVIKDSSVDMNRTDRTLPVVDFSKHAIVGDAPMLQLAPSKSNFAAENAMLSLRSLDRRCLFNITLLAIGSLFILIAMFTNAAVQELVVSGLNTNNHQGGFHGGEGYLSLALSTCGLAVVQFFSTPLIGHLLSPRLVVSISAFIYSLLFIAMLWPMVATVLPLAFVSGVALGLLFTAQFSIISHNSLNNARLMQRNSVIYWIISETAVIWGSILVYFCFEGEASIGNKPRQIVYGSLVGCTVIGGLTFLFMRRPPPANIILHDDDDDKQHDSTNQLVMSNDKASVLAVKSENTGLSSDLLATKSTQLLVENPTTCYKLSRSLFEPFRLLANPRMQLLFCPIIFVGLELTFMTAVSPTAIGFTQQFGINKAKSLSGLASIVCGIGEEILCILMVYLMWSRHGTSKFGRKWFQRRYFILLASVFFCIAYVIIFFNIPWSAPRGETSASTALFQTAPSTTLVFIAAFFMGAADAIFQTQMIAILGDSFAGPTSAPAAYAVSHFFQSLVSAASFVYTRALSLEWHLLILGVFLIASVVSYWKADKAVIDWKKQSMINSVKLAGANNEITRI